MSILTKPSAAFPMSLIYITVGTLIDVWTIVSLVFYPPTSNAAHFLVIGFLVTGIALLAIGLLLGPIGRAARHAELPPTEVMPAVARAEQTAAANPPPLVPVNSIAPAPTPRVMETTAPPINPRVAAPAQVPRG